MTSTESRIRFIAVDDNPLDLLFLEEMIRPYPFLQNCGTFTNPIEAHEALQFIKPDLIFLDVEMPVFTGIELIRKFRTTIPMAVFVTAHPDFAIEGFELSALGYLLKPITEDRFASAVARIQDFWAMKQKSQAYEILFEQQTLTIKDGYNLIRLTMNDIVYLEAMQDYTKIVTPVKHFMTLSPLSRFMDQLPSEQFVRVHRSYAVSVRQIRELRHSEVVCGSTVIPIGKTYRPVVSRLRSTNL